jgi:hypothetical protein
MLDHLRAAFIAVMLAFGLLAGGGVAVAGASPAAAMCQDQALTEMTGDHSLPKQECGKGMMDTACGVHMACGAILATLSGAEGHPRLADWLAKPSSSLTWTRLPPDTPPPIALS